MAAPTLTGLAETSHHQPCHERHPHDEVAIPGGSNSNAATAANVNPHRWVPLRSWLYYDSATGDSGIAIAQSFSSRSTRGGSLHPDRLPDRSGNGYHDRNRCDHDHYSAGDSVRMMARAMPRSRTRVAAPCTPIASSSQASSVR
jgi:hypothetical protein